MKASTSFRRIHETTGGQALRGDYLAHQPSPGAPTSPCMPRSLRFRLSARRWLAGLAVVSVGLLTPPALGLDLDPKLIATFDTEGAASDVVVTNGFAYVADGSAGLAILNVHDVSTPVLLGTCRDLGNTTRIVVAGDYAYLAVRNFGLQVVNIRNRGRPERVGGFNAGDGFDIAVAGSRAYVAALAGGLQILDVAEPSAPRLLGTVTGAGTSVALFGKHVCVSGSFVNPQHDEFQVLDLSEPDSPVRIGGIPGLWTHRIAVSGSTAYLTGGGLQIVDLQHPTSPQWVGGYPRAQGPVTAYGKTVLAQMQSSILTAVDSSEAARPRRIGSYLFAEELRGIATDGSHAFVAAGESGVHVLDLSPVAQPQRLNTIETMGIAKGVALAGSTLLIAQDWGGVTSMQVDASGKATWAGESVVPDEAYKVAVEGEYAYVASRYGLHVLRIHPGGGLEWLSRWEDRGSATRRAEDVAVSNGVVFVAYGSLGLQILDVSDPLRVRRLARYPTASGANSIALTGNRAYVGGGWLHIFDVTAPANPTLIGFLPGIIGVAVSGRYAFGTAEGGLQVIDIANPFAPQAVARCPDAQGSEVVIAGQYVYVAGMGLHVVDIRDPLNPRRVAGNSAFQCRDLAVAGNRVFVAADQDGVQVLPLYGAGTETLRLEAPTALPGGRFQFTVHGQPGSSGRIQRSLDAVRWQDWASFTLDTGSRKTVEDSEGGAGCCLLYRAVSP